MKIFSAEQMRQWDAFTIANEPVASIDLMERAATKCFEFIAKKFPGEKFAVFCGPGNNGGDGLAIARMLANKGLDTKIYLVSGKEGSTDFNTNLQRIQSITAPEILHVDSMPDISERVVIDAIFGNGLNKPIIGDIEKVIKYINIASKQTISIDIPSGMFADLSSRGNTIIRANHTLTFQQKKHAFYFAENSFYTGRVEVIDIGLHQNFVESTDSEFYGIDSETIEKIYNPRKPFSHKGNYGHACMVAGSYGMMGAAVLAARGCIRSGAGKLTCIVCEEGYNILQTTVPEAMCKVLGKGYISGTIDFSGFDVVGIGPGIGRFDSHKTLLKQGFESFKKPMVIDADALNGLSEYGELFQKIPEHSIITPHPKEFERLFGKTDNDFAQHQLALQKAGELNIYIILKGRHSFIAAPNGKGYFNTTGNPGMATGGSGDVLTGILTGMLAQHYSSLEACLLGVYLHGLAGDIAAKEISEEALVASDLYKFLGKAFLNIARP